jgi:hypothetical protein
VQIRAGPAKFYSWLKPGGRVFLVNDAIYRAIFKPLIPAYEQRLASGDEWPGLIEDVASCISKYVPRRDFPR